MELYDKNVLVSPIDCAFRHQSQPVGIVRHGWRKGNRHGLHGLCKGGSVMIKALTAYTSEVDDVEAAVSEILEQLKPGFGLLKNSIGILACYADFVSSGAVRKICAALPFDVVG